MLHKHVVKNGIEQKGEDLYLPQCF